MKLRITGGIELRKDEKPNVWGYNAVRASDERVLYAVMAQMFDGHYILSKGMYLGEEHGPANPSLAFGVAHNAREADERLHTKILRYAHRLQPQSELELVDETPRAKPASPTLEKEASSSGQSGEATSHIFRPIDHPGYRR